MVVVALLSVYLVESVYVVSVDLVVNCTCYRVKEHKKLGQKLVTVGRVQGL